VPEDTTETKITSIDDAVESILAPIEEPTEEVIESQATEEISAETETEEVVEEEEEEVLEASESEDDEDQEEDAVQEETPTFSVKVDGNIEEVTLDELKS